MAFKYFGMSKDEFRCRYHEQIIKPVHRLWIQQPPYEDQAKSESIREHVCRHSQHVSFNDCAIVIHRCDKEYQNAIDT